VTSSSPHDPPFSSILSYQCSDLKPPVPKNSEQGARFASFKHTVASAAVHRQLKLAIYPQALYTVNGTHAGSAYVSSASAAPFTSSHLSSRVLATSLRYHLKLQLYTSQPIDSELRQGLSRDTKRQLDSYDRFTPFKLLPTPRKTTARLVLDGPTTCNTVSISS